VVVGYPSTTLLAATYIKDKQFRKLSANTAEVSCTVIRVGKEHEVPSTTWSWAT